MCGSPCGRPSSSSRTPRLLELPRGGDLGRVDHLLPALCTHPVASHRGEVIARRLDQRDLRAEAAHLGDLTLKPPPRAERRDRREPVERTGAGRAGHRVEADHEVEAAAREQVEVRRGAHPAVDVAAGADAHRAVEAGDRARRGHGVGHLGARRAEAAERDAPAGRVVARDRPVVRMVDPAVRARRGRTMSLSGSVEKSPAGSQPATAGAACGGRVRSAVSASRSEPGTEPGQPAVQAEDAPPARSASAAGRPSGPVSPSKISPAEWATMNHGGMPAAEQRADHRARRGADDVVGAARVPAGLARERVEAAGEPRAAEHAARAEHQPRPHGSRRARVHRRPP